jgi:PHD/YefM family antitoxin component YafN of YafNO toxin-antitoxin module
MAVETTYSKLRQNLSSVLAQSDSKIEVFVVRRRKGHDIAPIPADELASILERAPPLSSPANARRLLKALRRADAHQGALSAIEQLRRDAD